jgi:hypothetical protein
MILAGIAFLILRPLPKTAGVTNFCLFIFKINIKIKIL